MTLKAMKTVKLEANKMIKELKEKEWAYKWR